MLRALSRLVRIARLLDRVVEDETAPPEQLPPIGVVFVHGIGSQPQSATVREFAQPLLDYLHEWHATRGIPDWQPESADLSYGQTLEGPARVSLRLPRYTRGDETWEAKRLIFAEAWWAARLDPPPLNTMIGWSLRTLVEVVLKLMNQMARRMEFLLFRGGRSTSDPGWIAALVEVLSGAVFIIVYFIAAIGGYMLLIPLLLIGQIPIKEVQEFILVKALKPFLVENLGDHETYMYDEVQALHMRAALANTVRALIGMGCEKICVVAHSQGALVAFDGVCALAREDPAAGAHVYKLITLGSALNRAFSQKRCPPRLQATLPPHVFWLDIWSYYDPVSAGYLRREHSVNKMVDPTDAFRQRMGWTARGADGKFFDGPMPDQVTNSLNPLVDHGGYFHNPEQFANRVLAEIDDPSGYYERSRFYQPRCRATRVRRRRTRIATLAGWRLAAIASVPLVLAARGFRLRDDVQAVLQAFGTLSPIRDALTAPGAFFDGVGAVLDRVGREIAQRAGTGVADAISSLRSAWSAVLWSDLLLAVLLYAAVCAILYWALLQALYEPWDGRERREAVGEDLPRARARGLLIAARTVGVLLVFGDAILAAPG
jgi:hypothetical protein